MMFGAIFLVMVKGTLDIGGLGVVWGKAVESGRIELPEWVALHAVLLLMFIINGQFALCYFQLSL